MIFRQKDHNHLSRRLIFQKWMKLMGRITNMKRKKRSHKNPQNLLQTPNTENLEVRKNNRDKRFLSQKKVYKVKVSWKTLKRNRMT